MATTVCIRRRVYPQSGSGWVGVGYRRRRPRQRRRSGLDQPASGTRGSTASGQANAGQVRVISASKYVVDCFQQRWHEGWERRGWKGSGGKPVASQDLWRPLLTAHRERAGQITFEWVKGHGGDAMNDVVDRLANEAARTQTGRRDTGPPTTLGAADTPRRARNAAGNGRLSSIAGRRVAALGLRPPALGGYDQTNPIAAEVLHKLSDILAGLRTVHPDLIVLTGLDLGAAQLAADAVAGPTCPASPGSPTPTADRRNQELLAAAHTALVVSDGHDRRTGDYVTALERPCPYDVWTIAAKWRPAAAPAVTV